MYNLYTNTNDPIPTTGICIQKNRVKEYLTNISKIDYKSTIYLENNSTFEIELFNPLPIDIVADIEINGKFLGSGVIIKPGQRIYLERFLDSPNKFKFETYLVESNNPEVDSAIKNNGMIKISFRKATQTVYFTNTWNNPITVWCGTGGSSGTTNQEVVYRSTTLTNNSLNSANLTTCSSYSVKVKETGKIEKGEHSDQEFGTSYELFEQFPFYSVEYKLIPYSYLPTDSIEFRKYCTNCGTRIKKSGWKYCPTCGNSI